jgi:hypothetical protein
MRRILPVLLAGALALLLPACEGPAATEKSAPATPSTSAVPPADPPPPRKAEPVVIDATKAGGSAGAVQVWLISTGTGPVRLWSLVEKNVSEESYFQIRVRLHNTHATRKFDYAGWATRWLNLARRATLKDEHGNDYKGVPFIEAQVVDQVDRTMSLYPGKWVDDVLVFEPPVERATRLILTLPLENVEGKGELHFHIPRAWNRYAPARR